jgi:uncharacterized membrane protein YgdD (TMEM256/DUF423 family)
MNIALISAAILGFLGVAIGAAGEHMLSGKVTEDALRSFHTALRYHQLHSIVLAAIGLSLLSGIPELAAGRIWWTSLGFLLGIILFSGSIYAYVFTGIRGITYLSPFGGITLMLS